MGDVFRAMKENGKEKRRHNMISNRRILIDKGIEYEEKANGHCIVGDYDFWLSTGLFIHRKTKQRGRGINNLLRVLKRRDIRGNLD